MKNADDLELWGDVDDGWYALMASSGRVLGGASIEGTADDWRGIAKALREGGDFRSIENYRCACRLDDDEVFELWSPRNTVGMPLKVPKSEGPKLARHIERVLAGVHGVTAQSELERLADRLRKEVRAYTDRAKDSLRVKAFQEVIAMIEDRLEELAL